MRYPWFKPGAALFERTFDPGRIPQYETHLVGAVPRFFEVDIQFAADPFIADLLPHTRYLRMNWITGCSQYAVRDDAWWTRFVPAFDALYWRLFLAQCFFVRAFRKAVRNGDW